LSVDFDMDLLWLTWELYRSLVVSSPT